MRNRTENQMTFVLIRHGKTKENEEHRYLGTTDSSLSKEGADILRKDKAMQGYPEIEWLFSSPMKRCLQTAEVLYPNQKPIVIKEWEEMDFGVFEGKNYMELENDDRYQTWLDSNGKLPFPEGESREEFILRCERGWKRMIEKLRMLNPYKESVVGLVVHGGTIMALLSRFLGGDYFNYQVPNGKGYICTVKDWETVPKIIELERL